MIPWHRLFGLGLTDLYHGTSYRVELEKDLSLKQQFLDVAVIAIEAEGDAFVELEDPPDGLEDLGRHNLLTYKSLREPLDAWAMDEFLCHFVNYRKQCSPSRGSLAPLSEFRMIAVTTRYPTGLSSEVALTKERDGVYNVKWGGRRVRVVVLGEVPEVPRNALWSLYSWRPERVVRGRRAYRWKCPDTSTVVAQLYASYRAEGLEMPYTLEDYKKDLLDEVVKVLPAKEVLGKFRPEERLQGLRPEERLRGLRPEERLQGLRPEEVLARYRPEEVLARYRPEERLRGLSREQILEYLKKLQDENES